MTDQAGKRSNVTSPQLQVAWNEYLQALDRGESVDAEDLLARHADIADELRSMINFDRKARLLANASGTHALQSDRGVETGMPPRPSPEVSTHSIVGGVEQTAGGRPKKPASFVSPAANDSELTGRFGGRYSIKKKLGSGAMGDVYLAEDTLLQRDVALKTPSFADDEDGELLKRFYREARAVSKLKHNNLCAVYDVGEFDGRHYISMEYVPGRKLTDFIKPDKPMTEKQAMAVVRKIALAMHEAHSHGVIHRDIKPDNIMINEKGEPVVMDFGLVHKTDAQASTKITQQGTLVGSPAYMSKEQVEGQTDTLTPATDQYSLGVVLYQLLTSKLPFEGGLHVVLGAILTNEPPPPSKHRPDLDPHLEAVCLKMMAKNAKDRYPSMKAAAEAIVGVVRNMSTTAGMSVRIRPEVRPRGEAAIETTFDPAQATSTPDEFDFNAPSELPPARGSSRRGRRAIPRGILIGSLAAGVILLFAIILFVIGDAQVKVEVLAEGYEVKFNEAEITITDGTRETKVKPGKHTLHIKSLNPDNGGIAEEFDTEQLTLKKGGQAVLNVTQENAEVVAKLNGKVIPRRAITENSTNRSNDAATYSNEKTRIFEMSNELIQNGSGAETGPGGLVGWKVLSGQWDKTYVWWKGKVPDYLVAGDVPSGTIEQDVDVSRFANAIDDSNVELKFSWKLQCFDGDVGRIEVILLDENRKELAAAYDSDWQNHISATDWKRFDKTTTPMKGVRYVRVRLSCKLSPRPGNRSCTAYVREISLRAIVKQPFTPPNVSNDGPWVSLFNGKDLTNWKLHTDQPGGWAVEDGLLVGRSWDTNHLFSESGDFENFHLRAELKTEHQSNGGIFIRSPFALDQSGKFPSGYEAQILHSHASGPWTGSLLTPGVPAIEQLAHERPVIAAGEWFTMDVIAVGNILTVKVNGKTTTNIRDGSNLFPKGHIALQAMVNPGVTTPTIIHFKKIEVKRLKMATTAAPGIKNQH